MAYVPMLMLLYDFENRNISLYALVAFQRCYGFPIPYKVSWHSGIPSAHQPITALAF